MGGDRGLTSVFHRIAGWVVLGLSSARAGYLGRCRGPVVEAAGVAALWNTGTGGGWGWGAARGSSGRRQVGGVQATAVRRWPNPAARVFDQAQLESSRRFVVLPPRVTRAAVCKMR